MSYLGDFNISAVLYTKFTTVNASGLPTTLGDAPTFGFYQDANTTLFTAGVSGTIDFNSTTGLNHLQLTVTGSATGITSGSSYQLVIATGSVSGVTMKGYVVGEFSVLTRSPLRPATGGRTLVVDSAGLADANVVKLGPTGAGSAQTARDIGASVLLSTGTGAGQLDFTSGVVKANAVQLLGTAWLTPGTAGTPDVNVKLWNALATVALPLVPTVAGRTLDVSAGGEAGLDWANVGTPGSTVSLSATTIATVTTATTATNLTNAPTNGDLTTAMKTSVENAVWDATAASHNTAGSTGAKLNSAASAGDPWSTAVPGAYGAGTAGFILGTNLDTTVSSRSTFSGGAVASVTGAVGSVSAGVTVTTNNDKTGYSLTQTFPSNFASTVISATGIISGDVKKVNGVTVNGAGTSGSPWGP